MTPPKPPKPDKPEKPMKPPKHEEAALAPVPTRHPQAPGAVYRLLTLATNPELVKGIWAMVRSNYPAFPNKACGATLSTFMAQAGFTQSFGEWAQTEINEALSEGWYKCAPDNAPQPGDIFVCADLNRNGATDHVGIVVRPSTTDGQFWAIDNRIDQCIDGKPYMRNTGPGKFTPVAYFIRYSGD